MTISKRILLVVLILVTTILLWNSDYGLLITALISYFIIIVDFIIQRLRIKSSKNLVIGKTSKNKKWEYLKLTVGILFILWGLFEKGELKSFLNINGQILFGIFILLFWLYNSSNYLILITDKSILFNDSNEIDKWKLNRIDEIVTNERKIDFYLGRERHKYAFENIDQGDLDRIKNYLSTKIKNGIIK